MNKDTKKRQLNKWTKCIFWFVVIPGFVVSILVPFIKLEASRTIRREAAERLGETNEQQIDLIKKIGLEEYSRRVNTTESNKELDGLSHDVIRQLEQTLREWLNGKDEIKRAGLHCVSVVLQKDASDGYRGLAKFDNGEQIRVEVGKEAESGELYLKAEPPALLSILSGMIPGYEYTTIGKAFNNFFADPNWITRISENGVKFVEFTGRMKQNLGLIEKEEAMLRLLQGETPSWIWVQGDQIRIRFAFSHDGEDFNLWSVQRGEDQPIRANDWENREMLNKFFEAIYDLK
ncbi:MAG: hypothetical protein A2167_01815 [Planctomycetes bacterium RBG_13_46_10]|nr:MAG: hypothetical protein A2167_01815 [Planctomycetes bacterium RBG_13_46_10]